MVSESAAVVVPDRNAGSVVDPVERHVVPASVINSEESMVKAEGGSAPVKVESGVGSAAPKQDGKGRYIVDCELCKKLTKVDGRLYDADFKSISKIYSQLDSEYKTQTYTCVKCAIIRADAREQDIHFCDKCNYHFAVPKNSLSVSHDEIICTICCDCKRCKDWQYHHRFKRTQQVCIPRGAGSGLVAFSADLAKEVFSHSDVASKKQRTSGGTQGKLYEIFT